MKNFALASECPHRNRGLNPIASPAAKGHADSETTRKQEPRATCALEKLKKLMFVTRRLANPFTIALLLPLTLLIAGCEDTVQSGLTGINITVKYDAELGLDQLRFTGTVGGVEAFPETNFPNPSRELNAGKESLVILLDDTSGGQRLELRADGLVGGQIVATEQLTAQIVAGRLSVATLTLEGSSGLR